MSAPMQLVLLAGSIQSDAIKKCVELIGAEEAVKAMLCTIAAQLLQSGTSPQDARHLFNEHLEAVIEMHEKFMTGKDGAH